MIHLEETRNDILTLSMLGRLVREAIESALPDSYWVQAEIASIHENRGHCYMELIEKGGDGIIHAQARACCWKNSWALVGRRFAEATGTPLSSGMKSLLCVRANFHEAYGFSWIVEDIDPAFTLGDMARRRREILRILTEQGVVDLNKQLTLSPFCKNIAVISSATAAGYGDFSCQLADNAYGFQFKTRLFPAVMQGEQVEKSVIEALGRVYEESTAGETPFDCVVIIRGGGSTADLSGFDTLALAENVANFPLPVITGIGHDRDKSILDVVACVSVKTPTAVAEYLIGNLLTTLERLDDCAQRITKAARGRTERERLRLGIMEQTLYAALQVRFLTERNRLENSLMSLKKHAERQVLVERNRLTLLEHRVSAADPVNILRRGYSITLHDGRAVRNAADLSAGDNITIIFADGNVSATVTN